MTQNNHVYLWVNLCDLHKVGTLGPFGSPLNLMIRPDLGDKLLDNTVYHKNKLDDMFVLVQCLPDRADALQDAIELIGNKKIGRKVRTRITKTMPDNLAWIKVNNLS